MADIPFFPNGADFNVQKLINLADGTNPTDGVTLQQLNAAIVGGVTFIGEYNPVTNTPNLTTPPASTVGKGDLFVASAAGSFFTETLEIGDSLISAVDDPASLSDWIVVQANVTHESYETNYFVSDEIGDDSNNGLSEISQFKTLGHALDVIEAAGVPASINITDNKTYQVTEGATAGVRDLGVSFSLLFPHATIEGQAGGVTWKVGSNMTKGYKMDGSNLTIEPNVGTSTKIYELEILINPTYFFVLAKSGSGSASVVTLTAEFIFGVGGIIDYDSPITSLFWAKTHQINTSSNTSSRLYDFIVGGSGNAISFTAVNYDSRNNGAGDFVPVLSKDNGRAYVNIGCIGTSIAGAAEAQTGGTVFISASDASDGNPMTYLGNVSDIVDFSLSEGLNFDKLAAIGATDLTDLINVRDISTGAQRKMTLTQLQSLVTNGFVTIATAQTITGGKTFTSPILVKEGAGSGLTADSIADCLVVDSDNLNKGMSILFPAGGNGTLAFGEFGNSNIAARVQYVGSVNELRLRNGSNYLRLLESGLWRASVAGYEALVLVGNDMPNKKYVDDAIVSAGADNSRGSMYVATSAATTIVTVNTPVKVNATSYAAENLVNFTESADGRLRYDGAITRIFDVSAALSMTGGNNDTYSFYVAKNGTVLSQTQVERKLGTGSDVGALPLAGSVSLSTNDYIEVWVENNTNADNCTITKMYVNIS